MLQNLHTTHDLIQTPLAKVWREGDFVFVCATEGLNQDSTVEDVHSHFDILERLTMGQKLPFVVDFTKAQPFLVHHKLRKVINERWSKISSCTAFYTDNIQVQFFTNLYFRLAPTRVPMKVFKDMNQAVDWVNQEHHKQTFSWSL